MRQNVRERWEKRLAETPRAAASDVLVLKSEYNTAWNFFSAKELGDTILGFWRRWCDNAEANTFNVLHPPFTAASGELSTSTDDRVSTLMWVSPEGGGPRYRAQVADIRKVGILNRRMIVSKKRTRNLFDLTSLWKKIVIARLDSDAVEDLAQQSAPSNVNLDLEEPMQLDDPVGEGGWNSDSGSDRRARSPDPNAAFANVSWFG
ncbi:hypothetical protein GGF50DRAFT_68214 [Schizophyllum commune]